MSMSLPNSIDDGQTLVQSPVLASVLNEIGALQCLQVFIDSGHDDNTLRNLCKLNPERISSLFGLSLDQAVAFTEKCRTFLSSSDTLPPPNLVALVDRPAGQATTFHDDFAIIDVINDQQQHLPSSLPSAARNPIASLPGLPAPPVDDATIMSMLNLEMIRELGRGSFGTVYEAKNLADRLKVALKIVKDPENAIQAIREGQRLRRVRHKNIVLMHKVHDIGSGSCAALEMEVVSGGDLSQHFEACRRRFDARFPHDAVLRLTRQLLEALAYLHDELKWLHGDIKPQNILLQCAPAPADGSAVDYSSAEIKLADFGLTKNLDQRSTIQSLMLSTIVGVLKGTMMYLSPEALQGASSGVNYERSVSDDLWSACLVIFEMDTGLPIHQLMTGHGGSVKIDLLLTKSSPELLPLLCSVLSAPSAASRCSSAAELLRKLDASIDPLFIWQVYDSASLKYNHVHPASSVTLEEAFSANQPGAMLPLQPPLDLQFDIQALLSSTTALGFQTERRSGTKCHIRRILKASVLSSSQCIPAWQELADGKEWLQCMPAMCAKLDIDEKNPNAVIDYSRYRRIMLESNCFDQSQLSHPMKSEPYLAPACANDVAILNVRVHDSLPEWDVTLLEQVVNSSLASKYAAYRHRVAARCNGNPNERMMFHFADPAVMTKIWQQGEGHDPRLSNWAEVGKGAYFSKHVMYGYAYKYSLWPFPPIFDVKPEPHIGESMQVFASLVCLGSIADMGPGCETCSSPAWDAWKREPPMPKPTRPPAVSLSANVAEKQHILDLTQVKDAPLYDSVTSTEGDLGTHPFSTSKDSSGRKICDVMHPRLRARAKEWAEQYVLFDPAASYPMFIATLTKTRDSPFGPQQLIDAGCDVNRIKALGFSSRHIKDLGKHVNEMRNAGWSVLDLKNAAFDARTLLLGCTISEMKSTNFTALQLKDAGCSALQLKDDFTLMDLLAANYDIPSLRAAGYSLSDMNRAGFSASSLKAVGCSAKDLKSSGYTASDLRDAGFDLHVLDQAGFTLEELKSAHFTDAEIFGTATFAIAEAAMQNIRACFDALKLLGASDAETRQQAENTAGEGKLFKRIQICGAIDDLMDSLRHPAVAKDVSTAQLLRSTGVKAYLLLSSNFTQSSLISAGYSIQDVALLPTESSMTSAYSFIFKHWKMLLAALLIASMSISIGLALGDIPSILVLVVCFPNFVAFCAHWKCLTKSGSKYPAKMAIGFAVHFVAALTLSLGIMLGFPSVYTYGLHATLMIFAVCTPMLLCFALHHVVWTSKNTGSPYPNKWKWLFALVFASIFALSLGLILLYSRPHTFSFLIAESDSKAGKIGISATLSFTPSIFGKLPSGSTITLMYPSTFFVSNVTPVISSESSSIEGLVAVCGPTTLNYVIITTAGRTIPSLPFIVTLSGFTLHPHNLGVSKVSVRTSSDLMASHDFESSKIALPISDLSFIISPSDRYAMKTGVRVILRFTPGNTIFPGGTISLSFPVAFFALSMIPVVPANSSNVVGLTAVCSLASNTSIVITTSDAVIQPLPFTLTISGFSITSSCTHPGGNVVVQTSTDTMPSAPVHSGMIYEAPGCVEDDCNSGFHKCHVNAICTNLPGVDNYYCTCRRGFIDETHYGEDYRSPSGRRCICPSDLVVHGIGSTSVCSDGKIGGAKALANLTGSSFHVAWSPNGSKIAASFEGVIRVWKSNESSIFLELELELHYALSYSNGLPEISWSPDGTKIALHGYNIQPHVWNVHSGALLYSLPLGQFGLAWSADGQMVASSLNHRPNRFRGGEAYEGTINIFDSRNGILKFNFNLFDSIEFGRSSRQFDFFNIRISDITWSSDGRLAAHLYAERSLSGWPYTSKSEFLAVWRFSQSRISLTGIYAYQSQKYPSSRLTKWSPDGSRLVVFQDNQEYNYITSQQRAGVFTWSGSGGIEAFSDAKSSPLVSSAVTLVGGVAYFAWSPRGNHFAVAYSEVNTDNGAKVSSQVGVFSTGGSLLFVLEQSGGVRSVEWSPDGNKFVIASDRDVYQLWSLTSPPKIVTNVCSNNLHNCASNAACSADPRALFSCRCQAGYGSDPTSNCSDINECLKYQSICDSKLDMICVNTVGSYKCKCKPFYHEKKESNGGISCFWSSGEVAQFRLEAMLLNILAILLLTETFT